MARPKSHQQKIVEIVEVEVNRLHKKAVGPAEGERALEAPPGGIQLTADDLDRLEVLARINKLIQVQLPKTEDRKVPERDSKAVLAELQGRMAKDTQADE